MTQEKRKVLGFDHENLGFRPKGKTDGKKAMTPTAQARDLMRETWSLQTYGKLENIFHQAVGFIAPRVTKQFTRRRARSIWEGTAKRIDSEEMDALREAQIEFARREQTLLRARLAALDEKIASAEASAHRQAMARPSQQMGR